MIDLWCTLPIEHMSTPKLCTYMQTTFGVSTHQYNRVGSEIYKRRIHSSNELNALCWRISTQIHLIRNIRPTRCRKEVVLWSPHVSQKIKTNFICGIMGFWSIYLRLNSSQKSKKVCLDKVYILPALSNPNAFVNNWSLLPVS